MNINPALPGKVRQHRNGTADRLKDFNSKMSESTGDRPSKEEYE